MKLPILLYHKIDTIPWAAGYPANYVAPTRFDAQLALLRRLGYETISFADYLAYRRGESGLPRRSVIITFDDGYRSLRANALPILRRHGFRATVFLVARLIGKTNAWDEGELEEPLLDGADIAAMQADGIDFQSHTLEHRRLTALEPAQALEDLRRSRECLGDLLGRPVRVLAYPYGEADRSTHEIARAAGYEAAVILRRRLNTDATDLFALNRIPVTNRTSLAQFAWDLFRLRGFYGS